MNNPNSEPRVVTIRLTPAQRSALECAGLDITEDADRGQIAVAAAWSGNDFDLTPDTFEDVLSGLIDLCNSEDAQAEATGDKRARGACEALTNLSAKVCRLRRPDRIKGDDDGVEYADPRDAAHS